jgi:cyclopropane fatty-acyl-phospholipid synthase-like methyltransferase
MTESASAATHVAEEYYNSIDADQFYSRVWGGEDIHIGIYEPADSSIADASARTVETMLARLQLGPSSRVIDLGAGYGGAARYLAHEYGCRVTCINVSTAQNSRNRRLNKRAELSGLIEVVHGSFEQLPVPSGTYDVAWSQDAILHSGDRRRVLEEVRRVLKPSGRFIFTDPMQADDCPAGALEAVYARLQLQSLSSLGYYRSVLAELGFREARSQDLTEQLVTHYSRVRAELEERNDELSRCASSEYLASMKQGLGHWIEAGRNGQLRWGIHCFLR